jgi:hypothetical protein
LGLTTAPWQGITGWAEAGSAMSYVTGQMLPDYRGGFKHGTLGIPDGAIERPFRRQ